MTRLTPTWWYLDNNRDVNAVQSSINRIEYIEEIAEMYVFKVF